ncbi:HNH endonuclease [Ancylobacter novellus]|uniref:HNH endonuclease n=1 Tax=Ancylobacter novellus TaxID=921 RepID=UPI0005A09C32|nr:HNH endonuclease signature motif containing protein [Ancylobacter novellus]
MVWGFERGRSYNRRRDIHDRFEGQERGGIVTPRRHPVVILITGEAGTVHGYADRMRPDGVFEYFGEGQLGDMSFIRGNAAIRNHHIDGRDLLVFRKTREGLSFEGQYVCEAFHYEPAPDRSGSLRQAIVFELRPIEALIEEEDEGAVPAASIADLQQRAFAAASPVPARSQGMRTVFERSRDVRNYVVARANGKCEACAAPAPFIRPNGQPYLEPHHIRRLSDGGPDSPKFVIGLCPNCHRRAHSSVDAEAFNNGLLGMMLALEP